MDLITSARELGKLIQQEESYKKLEAARIASDNDEKLQELIGEFNLKRMAINNEASKADRDDSKMQELNAQMRKVYADIMQNENMTAYNEAKNEFDAIMQRVLAIISQSAEGENPETADYHESCSGSCSTCGGCH
ncbi:MAG: YlbF family regulator [Acutalibacteraceae bacterium]